MCVLQRRHEKVATAEHAQLEQLAQLVNASARMREVRIDHPRTNDELELRRKRACKADEDEAALQLAGCGFDERVTAAKDAPQRIGWLAARIGLSDMRGDRDLNAGLI